MVSLKGGVETVNGIKLSIVACQARKDDKCELYDSNGDLFITTESEAKELVGILAVWGEAQYQNMRKKRIYVKSLDNANEDIPKVLAVTWDSEE